MTTLLIKSREQILSDLVRYIVANSDITDLNAGSTVATLLEAIASVQFQNSLNSLKILESQNIDSLTGTDLDKKAQDIGLSNYNNGYGRIPSSYSSGMITISTNYTKASTFFVVSKPAPFINATVLYLQDAASFPVTGSIYLGRNNNNEEGPIAYSSCTFNGSYYIMTLSSPLTKQHSLQDDIILARNGNQTIKAGTQMSSSDGKLLFNLAYDIILKDGDEFVNGTCICTSAGSIGNVAQNTITKFISSPFTGSTVTNSSNFYNGVDLESDEALRARIKNYNNTIQNGTKNSIIQQLIGLQDNYTHKIITSVKIIDQTDPTQILINDSLLLEPDLGGLSYSELIAQAYGTEQYFKVNSDNLPISLYIQGTKTSPFALEDLQILQILVDGTLETVTINKNNYTNIESASVYEIINDFNSQSTLVSFRSINNGLNLLISPVNSNVETLQVINSDLSNIFGLTTSIIRPIYLYKNNNLLSFKGSTANITTNNFPFTSLIESDLSNVQIQVDGHIQTFTITNNDFGVFGKNISTASLDNWKTVLLNKISGVSIDIVNATLSISSLTLNSNVSYLKILPKTVQLGTFAIVLNVCTITTPTAHGLNNGDIVVLTSSTSDQINNISYIITKDSATSFHFDVSIVSASGMCYFYSNYSTTVGWIGLNKIWGDAEESQGSSQDYAINFETGDIVLQEKLVANDSLSISNKNTKGNLKSLESTDGYFTLTPTNYGNSRLLLSVDSTSFNIRNLIFQDKSNIKITKVDDSIIKITAYNDLTLDSLLFQDIAIGDYIYLNSNSDAVLPFPTTLIGFYRVKKISTDFHDIYLSISSIENALFVNGASYYVDLQTFFAFNSTTIPQVLDFGSSVTTISVDDIITNYSIHNGNIVKINNKQLFIETNNYNGNICLFGIIGNASTLFATATQSNDSIPLHTPNIYSNDLNTNTFPISTISNNTINIDVLKTSIEERNDIVLDVYDRNASSYPLGFNTYWIAGKNINSIYKTYTTQIVNPFQGIIRDEYLLSPLQECDSLTNAYNNFAYRMEDINITENDKFNITVNNNTYMIPFYKKAAIQDIDTLTSEYIGSVINIKLQDPEDLYDQDPMHLQVPRPFFNAYSPFRNFDLKDFKILTKSTGVYAASGATKGLVLRGSINGGLNQLRFNLMYNLIPNRSTSSISHVNNFVNNINTTTVNVFMPSNSAKQTINSGNINFTVAANGNLFDLTFLSSSIDSTKFINGDICALSAGHFLSGAFKITNVVNGVSVTCLAPGLDNWITPSASVSFETQSDSNIIKVHYPTHGFLTNDIINTSTLVAVNGIAAVDLSITGALVTKVNDDYFTYEANATANPASTGNISIVYPNQTATITATPNSSIITLSIAGHNYETGDAIDVTVAPVAGLGGLSQAQLQVSNSLVSYINSTLFTYDCGVVCPSNTAIGSLTRTSASILIKPTVGTNIIVVTHNTHGLNTGSIVTMSGYPTIAGIPASEINASHSITRNSANEYQFTVSSISYNTFTFNAGAAATATTYSTVGNMTINAILYSNVRIDTTAGSAMIIVTLPIGASMPNVSDTVTPAAYTDTGGISAANINGARTVTSKSTDGSSAGSEYYQLDNILLTCTPNSTTVTLDYANHNLTGGTFTLTPLTAFGGLTIGQITGSITLTLVNINELTCAIGNTFPAITGSATMRRAGVIASATVPNGWNTTNGYVLMNVVNHKIITSTITTSAALAIGGISNANLSGSFTVTIIDEDNFSYIANGTATAYSGTITIAKPTSFAATDYSLSCYSLPNYSYQKLINDINAYNTSNPVISSSGLGTNLSTSYITDATYIINATTPSTGCTTMDEAFDFYAFVCKYSGIGTIYEYPRPIDFATITDYNNYLIANPNPVKVLLQTAQNLFPLSTEVQLTGYTPIDEELYLVPTNLRTIKDWMNFTLLSSITYDAEIKDIYNGKNLQISSKILGSSGNIQVNTGYANDATLFIKNNENILDTNTFIVNTNYIATKTLSKNSLVKITNQNTSKLLRPYRKESTGTALTVANTADITTYFRKTTEIEYKSVNSKIRMIFKRNGQGTAQTEPLAVSSDITVRFANLTNGVVQVTIMSGGVKLSARIGDMLYINQTSNTAIPTDIVCPAIPAGYILSTYNYIGYPVIDVIDDDDIKIYAPNITSFGTYTILNPNVNTANKYTLIFLPTIINQKNIRTNMKEGIKYETSYGTLYYQLKKLNNNFMSLIVSNNISGNEVDDNMLLSQSLVKNDDYIELRDSSFSINNKGIFKIVAHNNKNIIIFYNPAGEDQLIDSNTIGVNKWLIEAIDNRPIKIYDAEHLFSNESYIQINSGITNMDAALVGKFLITDIGYFFGDDFNLTTPSNDPTKLCQYIEFDNSTTITTSIKTILGNNNVDISFETADPQYSFKKVLGYSINTSDTTIADLYLQPYTPNISFSENNGSYIEPISKLGFTEDVLVKGIDGLSYNSGLLQTAHHLVQDIKSAGTSFVFNTPLLTRITMTLKVILINGIYLSDVKNMIQNEVAGFINQKNIGDDLIVSELISTIQNLNFVTSVIILDISPNLSSDLSRVVIGDLSKAYVIDPQDIIITV